MNNDLISRSELLRQIRNSQKDNPFQRIGSVAMVWHNVHAHVCSIIDAQEGSDTEPVRRGRWMPYYEPMECFVDVYLNTEIRDVQVGWICSECGRHEQHSTVEEMPYCHCGAKMDAEVEE